MTTTEVRRAAPRAAPDPAGRPPAARGPLVLAAVVLLLWGVWLLVPHGTRLDLLGGEASVAAARPAGPAADAVRPPAAGPVDPAPAGTATAEPAPAGGAAPDGPGAGEPAPAVPVEVPKAGDGTFSVAPGTGEQVGEGRLVRYTVEVEGGVPLDAVEVAAVVEAVLADPRSWTAGGWALQRVDADPDARIVVTSPDTTDRMCAPLRTRGQVSCRNGDDVVLNAVRWTQGASTWGDDVAGYRQYLVNHELGHYLGRSHVRCPGDGEPAPVMLQQTLGLQGCRANAWPYP